MEGEDLAEYSNLSVLLQEKIEKKGHRAFQPGLAAGWQ